MMLNAGIEPTREFCGSRPSWGCSAHIRRFLRRGMRLADFGLGAPERTHEPLPLTTHFVTNSFVPARHQGRSGAFLTLGKRARPRPIWPVAARSPGCANTHAQPVLSSPASEASPRCGD